MLIRETLVNGLQIGRCCKFRKFEGENFSDWSTFANVFSHQHFHYSRTLVTQPCLSVPSIIQNDMWKFLKQVIPNC